MTAATGLAKIMPDVAKRFWGEPNKHHSKEKKPRWGTNGARCVDVEKGVWFDNESNKGGGVLELIKHEGVADPWQWLRDNGFPEYCDNGAAGKPKIVATYGYTDEHGTLLFQVCRKEQPKTFVQRRPPRPDDPPDRVTDGWVWSVKDVVPKVPFRLPEIIEALALEQRVFIVEGEKDVLRLADHGITATCNAGGAHKWVPSFAEYFVGADVIVIPDNDMDGRAHAQEVACSLTGKASRIRILELPGLPEKGDVSDWFATGGTVEAFNALVEQAPDWIAGGAEPAPGSLILPKIDFLKGFEPPDYLVDGILQRRFIYALTGQTGHGKTAIALVLKQAISSRDEAATFAGHRVEKGRVVYFAGENPDDLRMRVIGADALRSDDPAADQAHFISGVFNISELRDRLVADTQHIGGADLVIVDTSPAFFFGNDENSNPQMGAHARMLRTLTTLPGRPCVIVLCHPIKNVTEPAQLWPRGGGAFVNELDGNLTAWRHDETLVDLHYNKMRGPGFEPVAFRLEKITTPKLVDAKGRMLPTVRAVSISEAEQAKQTQHARSDEDQVLAAMLYDPTFSIADIACCCGWLHEDGNPYKTRVMRALDRLRTEKPQLVKKQRGQYVLTEEGKTAARKAALKAA